MSRTGYYYWSVLRAGTRSGRAAIGRRKNRLRTRQRRLAVEHLEVRTVLSANPLYALPNDTFAFEASAMVESEPVVPRVLNQNLAGGGSALETSPFPLDQT